MSEDDWLTESDWAASTDSWDMVLWMQVARGASDRKLRLLAVACCRGVLQWLADGRARDAIEVAERLADGLATEQERRAAFAAAEAAFYGTADRLREEPGFIVDHFSAYLAAYGVADADAGRAVFAASGWWGQGAHSGPSSAASLAATSLAPASSPA